MQQEYIFVLIFSLLLFRVVVIVFHEFGHAFASLLNSDGDVSVYIGSHGNPEKSFRFKIKRLECFIKYNLFKWSGGLCISHGKGISWKGSFLISLFGPLTTLLLGIISIIFLQFIQNDLLFVILSAFAFSCIFDFIYNIIPKNTQIQLHDGTFTNNDGKQLVHLWNIRKIYSNHEKGLAHYDKKEFLKAAKFFEECIVVTPDNPELYRLAISSYLVEKKDAKAVKLQEVYSAKFDIVRDVYDYTNVGIIEIHKKNYTKALEAFEEALLLNPNMIEILNNHGFILGILERHEEAISQLDKAISIGENAYCYCNRGYSKLQLGYFEEGLADTLKALNLDPEDAYVYRNFGIYHFHRKEYIKALEFYQKCFYLDPETHRIEELIDEVNTKLTV